MDKARMGRADIEDPGERAEMFEAAVDMAHIGVLVVDNQEEVQFVNTMMAEITGHSKIEIYREGLSVFLSEQSLSMIRSVIENLNGRGYAELPVISRTGNSRECEFRIDFRGRQEDRRIFFYVTDVTEQKEMEAEMRFSEEKYGYLFESIHHGIFISSKAGNFLDCNPALLTMMGYDDKDEFLRLSLARDVYKNPRDREKFQDIVQRDGHVKDFEVVFRKRSDEEITILLSARALTSESGEITAYQGIIIDITERKKKEDRAREVSEERYRRLFESIRDPVYITTREGRCIDCNPAFLEMMGYDDKAEFLALGSSKSIYRDRSDGRRFQEAVERDGYVKDMEVTLKKKSEEDVTVLITAQIMRNERGEVIGYEGMMKDITERHQAEKDLAEVNEFLNIVIEASPDAIIVSDKSGDVMMYNAAAEQLLGYPFAEVVGRKARSLNLYPRRLAKRTREMIMEEKGTRKGILRPIEFYVQNKAQKMVETSLSAAILYNNHGEEIGSIAIFKDMRELAGIKRRLRHMQEQLVQSERLAAMGRLTSQIAHEVNNPLYGIMNTLELLKGEIPETSKKRRLLDMSLSEIGRLAGMLKNMLAFSRPGGEARKDVEISPFLEGSLLLMEKQLEESGIKLFTNYGRAIPPVRVSPNQLRQVIINIVKNGIEAMPQGGVLSISTEVVEGHLQIAIRDSGVGMSEDVKKQIFDAFFTTKDEVKGVGLGLSVCYGIIRDHGGQISVESQPGKGSVFLIALPLASMPEIG
jgi:PAS domain S-box-containing protein